MSDMISARNKNKETVAIEIDGCPVSSRVVRERFSEELIFEQR